MINVGICGLGFMGRTHFGIYEKNDKARVLAMMDADPRRRAGDWKDPIGNLPSSWPEQVDMQNRRSYATIEELVADKDVDVIDITLPTNFHTEAAIKALKKGKHVLCEKPMALTRRECLRIVRQTEKSKTFFMAAHCIRFWPQYVRIRELITSGQFGEPRSATLIRLASTPQYTMGSWAMKSEVSGGAIFDLHIHDIDFALYLFGRPKAVYAQGTSGPSGGVDHVKALWDYGKDLLVYVEGGWCFHPGWPFQMIIRVRCEKATVEWNMAAGNDVVVYPAEGGVRKVQVKASSGWDEEIDYFLTCVQRNEPPTVVTARSSMEAVELAEAEFKSVKTGKKVPVRE